MATSLEDLIQAGLETADCEKSNNFSTPEKTRIVNEALSEAYDVVVSKWDSYFATSATFTLPSTNVMTLAEVTTGSPSGVSTFYKELGLTRTDGGCNEPIDPLPGYPSRNQCQGRRYWIQGQVLSLWPQVGGVSHAGTYVLDFVPNCPVLTTGQFLPVELERWKELIEVIAGIKFMTKRRQDTSDLERRQAKIEAGIVVAAGSRKAEVRKLRPLRNHDQLPGFGWRNPYLRS